MESFSDEQLAGEKNSYVPMEAATVESSCSWKVAVPPYSEKEAHVLAERLANKDSYREARKVLLTWLEKGECNESNSDSFFSLIKLCSKTVNKLKIEQKECQQKAENTKKNLLQHNCVIQCDLDKIGNAFEAVQRKEVWNNFTETQKNNIKMMKKEYLDLKEENLLDIVKEPIGVKNSNKELQIMREKERSMTSRLQALREEAKDLKTQVREKKEEILRLKSELERSRKNNVNTRSSHTDYIRQNETQIICLISMHLVRHYENSLSLQCIHSYLRDFFPSISERDVEILLRRFPALFEQTGFGSEITWFYAGFNGGERSGMN